MSTQRLTALRAELKAVRKASWLSRLVRELESLQVETSRGFRRAPRESGIVQKLGRQFDLEDYDVFYGVSDPELEAQEWQDKYVELIKAEIFELE